MTGSVREVLLTVTGVLKYTDGKSDRYSTQSPARSEKSGDTRLFKYREKDPQSGAATDVRMVFTEQQCRIERRGEVNSDMLFEPGKVTFCAYETRFGTIPIKIAAKRIAMRETGQTFRAVITYNMELEGGLLISCTVTVKAEPAER